MARPLRIEYNGALYHLTSRGNERKRIYYAQTDYERFKGYLREAQEKYGYSLYCYVLMSNHYHLLIETPNGNVSKVMQFINGSYTTYINRRKRRSGHLFQGRYKAVLIDRDSYLLELSRYLHLNPVRAKMVSKPEQYRQSSYRSYIFKNKEDIINRDLILEMIAKDKNDAQKGYRAFVEKGIGEPVENPLRKVYAGAILGGESFIKEALSRLKDGVLTREEISHRREFQAGYRSEEIIESICSHFELTPDQLLKDRKELRNISIYLMKKLTGMTNRQIGSLFGGLSFSGVTRAQQRFEAKLRKDKRLGKRVEQIRSSLANIKG